MAQRVWRGLTYEGFREIISEAVRNWILPVVVAAVGSALTMLSGLFSPVPLPYLIGTSVAVFGFIAWAALQIQILRERLRVRDRLFFENIWFGRDFELRNGNVYIKVVQLGFHLNSLADFPIYYKVATIRSSFDARISTEPHFHSKGGVVLKGRTTLFRDAPIPLGDGIEVVPGQRFDATLAITVAYGKTSKTYPHTLEHNFRGLSP